MLIRLLLSLLVLFTLSTSAFAGTIELLPAGPLVADGQTTLRVAMRIPGLTDADKVRARPESGELIAVSVAGPELVILHIKPVAATQADTLTVTMSVRGVMKLDEDIELPLLPPPSGEVVVSLSAEVMTYGAGGTATVTLRPQGAHPLPQSARSFLVTASEGKVSALTAAPDGSYTATWTPPAKGTVPGLVLFTATDATSPDRVVGFGTMAMAVKTKQVIDAPAGSRNTLVIGDVPYGPATATAEGKVTFDAVLDPRKPTGTLQSVDATARRTDSIVDLKLGSPTRVAFAPLPPNLPAGAKLRLNLLVLQGDGRPWSGAAPTLQDGTAARNEGKGWFSFDVTTPDTLGAWKVTATADGVSTSLSATLVDPLPALTASVSPPVLKKDETAFAVTVNLKDAQGRALTGRKLNFVVVGATAVGAAKDNGDGTTTAKYKLNKDVDAAQVRVSPILTPTGLPPARLVVWPRKDSVTADGSATVEVFVVALDAFGIPVPNVAINVSAPRGDGALAPTATTDKNGMAVLSYRAGSVPGAAAVRVEAKGVLAETLLMQTSPGAAPLGLEPPGSDDALAARSTWRAAWPTLQVAKIGVDVGPPTALTVATVPSYTTPGAAILVTVRVLDAQGKAVLDATPVVTASPGNVGAITNNGDGTYNLPVMLPAGVDGPLNITVVAGAATGAVNLPTLGSIGASSLATTSGSSGGGGGGGGRAPKGGAAPAGDVSFRLRASAGAMGYLYSATTKGVEGPLATDAAFRAVTPLLVGSAELWPGASGIGVDGNIKLSVYRVQIGLSDEVYNRVTFPGHVALRYRKPLEAPGTFWFVSGGARLTETVVFGYENDDKTQSQLSRELVPGGRIGGGVIKETDRVYLRAELAETITPWPSVTSVALGLDAPLLPDGSLIHVGLDYDLNHMRLDENDDGQLLRVRGQQISLSVGVGQGL
jgi:hypothetical protein